MVYDYPEDKNMFTPERLLEVTRYTIKKAEYCFLVTTGEVEHTTSARLMQPFEPEDDFTIWFGASPHSRKVREIKQNDLVTLGYAHPPDGAYVSIYGVATIVGDIESRRQYWRESFKPFWPDGPQSEDYILIRVVPSKIEVMNIEEGVSPDPYGLKPEVLIREGEDWIVEES
jgi:general stress protein 26